MTQTIITAGDASAGLVQQGGNDGTLVLQTGAAGAKVNAASFDTSGNAAFLANVTAAGVDLRPIGVGQSWQDVTSSRAASTNYTNTTGRPIMVSIYPAANNSGGYDFIISGLVINHAYSNTGYGMSGVMLIVPPAAVYSFTGPFAYWRELR